MLLQTKIRSGLNDATADTGWKVPYGRQEAWWKHRLRISPRRIGVKTIRKESWLHDPDEAIARFRLRSIEFGNWMSHEDRVHWLYGAMIGLEDLATILGVAPEQMGFDGMLSIGLGARGRGGKAMAHYEPHPNGAINLTKTRGDGCLAHEYGHMLDNIAGVALGVDWATGGHKTARKIQDKRLAMRDSRGILEELFQDLLYEGDAPSKFNKRLNRVPADNADYWNSRLEVFARTFETWVGFRKLKLKIANTFLCEDPDPDGTSYRYPPKVDIDRIDACMRAFVAEVYSLKVPEKATARTPKIVIGSSATKVVTQDSPIPAKYALVEISNLITSHDPRSWKADDRYPNDCQQRDYTRDPGEQLKVDQGSRNLDPSFLLTDTPSALDGPPIVMPAGNKRDYIVLGGNGRTMMLRRSVDSGRYADYLSALEQRASHFGIQPEELRTLDTPVLVRVIDGKNQSCAYWSNVLNKGLTQGIDHTTESFALARQLPSAALELFAEIIADAGVETMAELFGSPRSAKAIVGLMRKAKIITDRNASEYLTRTGEISDAGRFKIQSILLGALLQDATLTEKARNYTAQILRVAPTLIRIRSLGDQWDILPLIKRAIELESERRSTSIPKEQFLRQTSFVRDEVPEDIRVVWDALDSGIRAFAAFVEGYLRRAQTEAQGSGLGFNEPLDRTGLLKTLTSGLSDHMATGTRDLVRRPVRTIPFTRFADFLGDEVPEPFSMLIWGQKGNGKSSFTLHLADELGQFGEVYLNTAEEPVSSPSLLHRIEKTGVRLDNVRLDTCDDWTTMMQRIERRPPRFIIIDSIQKLSIFNDELQMLRSFVDNRRHYSWIFVGRAVKDADFAAGRSGWGYEVDIEVQLRNMVASIVKHRYMDPRQWKSRRYRVLDTKG